MNVLAEMFDDIFGKNVNYDIKNYEGPVLMHCLQPYHLMKKGIHISAFREGGVLIRESYRFNEDMSLETTSITVGNSTIKQQANTNTGWPKSLPSDSQVLRLLEEKGPLWILDPENQKFIEQYIKNSSK